MMTFVLLFVGMASASEAVDPEPCSVSVGIVNRIGRYRTWTNALETEALAEKGLEICQDDMELSSTGNRAVAGCKTEFKLELYYHPDWTTRNLSIYKNVFNKHGKLRKKKRTVLFSQDYPNDPMSQRIMRMIPSCADLEKLTN